MTDRFEAPVTDRLGRKYFWEGLAPGAKLTTATHGVVGVQVPTDLVSIMSDRLAAGYHGRLADLFVAQPAGAGPRLYQVWAMDAFRTYLVIDTPVDGSEFPSPGSSAPAAFVEECEIYEQFGFRTPDEMPLNRVAVPPIPGMDIPRLGHRPAVSPDEVHAPHLVGGSAFEFPVGPVRAAGFESLYYGLVTSGEEIVDLYLFTWHKHRGLEWRLQGLSPQAGLFLVERVEGLSAVANGWAFAHAVEQATDQCVSSGALLIRSMALELERLYNHAAAIAALCQSTGLSVGQANAEIALELLLRLNCAVFGHRYLFGVVDIGGIGRMPDLSALQAGLVTARDELRRVTDALAVTDSFLDRLEATGIVSTEQAARFGLVGPIARAAGMSIDTRRDHPYACAQRPAGREIGARVVTRTAGDVLARFQVFLGEIEESARILAEFARTPAGDLTIDPHPAPPTPRAHAPATGLGWAESSRGESLAWVAINERGLIERARIRPGSARNWRGFDDACRSQNVFTDIPIIEASFWLTAAGMAR